MAGLLAKKGWMHSENDVGLEVAPFMAAS